MTYWCSPSKPQTGCNAIYIAGEEVCKPMDHETLVVFKDLQSTINVLLKQDGKSTIKVDGRPGKETVAAANVYISPTFSDCNELSMMASAVVSDLKNLASKRANDAASVGFKVVKPESDVKKAGMGWWGLLIVAGIVGTAWYVNKKEKGASHAQSVWL